MPIIDDLNFESGLLLDVWNYHKNGEQVFPFLDKTKTAFYISSTGKNTDDKPINVENFIKNLADGDYSVIGSIRMKPKSGGTGNLRPIRKCEKSNELNAILEKIRTGNSPKISISNSSDKINETKIANKPFQVSNSHYENILFIYQIVAN